ncbi:MAG TPA: cobalamin-binding protein [Chloroflexota bacterium]
MRIVSLLPSATEIVCALGLADQLVGVTHECDYPPAALAKARVTSTALPPEARTSRQIDDGINTLLDEAKSIYHLDLELLERLQPDLILTQELCDVCAVAYAEVNRAAASVSSKPRVVSLEPNNLGQVLDSILTVGQLTGADASAEAYVAGLRRRLDALETPAGHRPRVYCMEWLDPPMRAGHWIPEMVQLAGGEESFANRDQPSTKTTWEDIRAYAPDVIVLMPCGFDLPRTLEEAATIQEWPAKEVWAVNGSAYFSRPGPRLVDGVELLAHILGHTPPGFQDRALAKECQRLLS